MRLIVILFWLFVGILMIKGYSGIGNLYETFLVDLALVLIAVAYINIFAVIVTLPVKEGEPFEIKFIDKYWKKMLIAGFLVLFVGTMLIVGVINSSGFPALNW